MRSHTGWKREITLNNGRVHVIWLSGPAWLGPSTAPLTAISCGGLPLGPCSVHVINIDGEWGFRIRSNVAGADPHEHVMLPRAGSLTYEQLKRYRRHYLEDSGQRPCSRSSCACSSC
jgi:hypothetical protein